MIKSLVLAFVFLFSLEAAAQICHLQKDGTCYNDDLIGKSDRSTIPFQPTIDDPPHTMIPPLPEPPPKVEPLVKKKKIRKYPGGFVPVGEDEDPPLCNDADDSPDSQCRSRGKR